MCYLLPVLQVTDTRKIGFSLVTEMHLAMIEVRGTLSIWNPAHRGRESTWLLYRSRAAMLYANMDRRNEAAPQVLPLSIYGVVLASFTSKVASQNKGNLARLRKSSAGFG